MSELIERWLQHYDPIHRGWTREGIAYGRCATNGYSFPRIRGGYLLRRHLKTETTAEGVVVGSAGADAETVTTFPWVAHAVDAEYMYHLTAINGGGVENSEEPASAQVRTDSEGHFIGPRPNAPMELRVKPAADGRFRLEWRYVSAEEQVTPQGFRLYHDDGTGIVDYGTVIATVGYEANRVHYRYDSTPFPHGALRRWAVRAVSPDGVESVPSPIGRAWSDAESPPCDPAIHIVMT